MSGNDHEMASMEEGRKEKNGWGEQGGETSGGSDEIIEKGKELSNKARENLKVLYNFLPNEESAGDHHQEPATKPSIPKIPDVLRSNQNFTKYFEPRMVSIGPYHHKNHELKVTQQTKLKLAAMFIKEHCVNMEELYLCIIMEIGNLRRCYETDATQHYIDDDLAWMFLIDGCVVLHFIFVRDQAFKDAKNTVQWLEIIKLKGFESLQGETEFRNFRMDLLLLENQLPYEVLNLLINSSQNSSMLKESVQEFIIALTYSGLKSKLQRLRLEHPAHLLDQMRAAVLIQSVDKKSSFIMRMLGKYSNKIKEMLSGMLLLIIPDGTTETLDLTSLHNIVALKEGGVKIKSSGTCYFTDISFSRGTLKLPSLVVNKVTMFKFLNLVGYEMCLNVCEFEVFAYLCFLASLIDQVEDVRELCNNKIFLNFSDSDQEILKIFQELRANDMCGALDVKFATIIIKINEHCSKRHNAWIAQLKNKYFESPWSVIALVGAFTALSVTILQTVYTVLGYYRSPKV